MVERLGLDLGDQIGIPTMLGEDPGWVSHSPPDLPYRSVAWLEEGKVKL